MNPMSHRFTSSAAVLALLALTLAACTTAPPAPTPPPAAPTSTTAPAWGYPDAAQSPPPSPPLSPAQSAPAITPLPLPPLLHKRTQAAQRLQPVQIWQLVYQGKPAFYMVEDCCDRMNTLHDSAGYARCAPSGGLTGRGDGRCPAPLPSTNQMRLVWERAR